MITKKKKKKKRYPRSSRACKCLSVWERWSRLQRISLQVAGAHLCPNSRANQARWIKNTHTSEHDLATCAWFAIPIFFLWQAT